MKKALGIDIGGTKIYAAQIDEMGNIITQVEKYATAKTAEEIVEKLKEIISKHEKVGKLIPDSYIQKKTDKTYELFLNGKM